MKQNRQPHLHVMCLHWSMWFMRIPHLGHALVSGHPETHPIVFVPHCCNSFSFAGASHLLFSQSSAPGRHGCRQCQQNDISSPALRVHSLQTTRLRLLYHFLVKSRCWFVPQELHCRISGCPFTKFSLMVSRDRRSSSSSITDDRMCRTMNHSIGARQDGQSNL